MPKKVKAPKRVIDIPTLRVYAALPSLINLRWVFLAFIETLEENERLKKLVTLKR